MKVVKGLDQENLEQDMQEQKKNDPPVGIIRMKKFHFAMLLLLLVILTAGITSFAMTFGDEKVVTVGTERKEFAKLYATFDTLKGQYYKDVKDTKLINGAINGMVEALGDPYSDYMNEEEAGKFHQSVSASFEGIGAEIQEKEGHIVIVTPLKGSPAEKAGIKPNDKVLSVDGKSVQGMSSTEAVMLIRGKKGTKVEIAIGRAGLEEPMNVSIVRDTIPLKTVYGEMLEDGIAKVQITSFSPNTTKDLLEVLTDMQSKGMKGLVLDLRQNPGGLLEQAVNISSMFVPNGKVLFKVEDRAGKIKEYKSQNEQTSKIPLVVVIDKGSASAAEIFAGAVRESAGVSIVGETSFGKGTVQRAQDFPDGSNFKFTTEKWLTPNGNWIHEKGIKPDFEVGLPEYASLTIINPDKEWKLDMSSNEIKVAQKMLIAIGYEPGREDGFFDENTKAAIISFQKDKNIEANGILTGQTTLTLMDQLRQQIINNDTQIQKAVEVLKPKMGL
jgi:carboxyl-terminal processing protease